MSVEVRLATTADTPGITRCLARAFHDDPIKVFLARGASLTTEQVRPFFDAFTRIQLAHGHVYTTPGHEAAALWAPPGTWKVPFRKVLRYAPRFIDLYGHRVFANLQVLTDLERLHPTEPHYYLEFVGTDPAHRGRGLGTALIEPVLERADSEGVGAYLENSKASNLAFYSRFGFEVAREMTHRRGGPPMWLMWRDPR